MWQPQLPILAKSSVTTCYTCCWASWACWPLQLDWQMQTIHKNPLKSKSLNFKTSSRLWEASRVYKGHKKVFKLPVLIDKQSPARCTYCWWLQSPYCSRDCFANRKIPPTWKSRDPRPRLKLCSILNTWQHKQVFESSGSMHVVLTLIMENRKAQKRQCFCRKRGLISLPCHWCYQAHRCTNTEWYQTWKSRIHPTNESTFPTRQGCSNCFTKSSYISQASDTQLLEWTCILPH